MEKHFTKAINQKKKADTSACFSKSTENSVNKETLMSMGQLMDAKEFQIHSKLSKSTIQRRILDGSLKVWQPGGKGTRVLIYADNLLRSKETKAFQPEFREPDKNKKNNNTSPRWLK